MVLVEALLQDSDRFLRVVAQFQSEAESAGQTAEAVERFAPQFAAEGIVPVMGAGSASEAKQPEPLEPGSAVSR